MLPVVRRYFQLPAARAFFQSLAFSPCCLASCSSLTPAAIRWRPMRLLLITSFVTACTPVNFFFQRHCHSLSTRNDFTTRWRHNSSSCGHQRFGETKDDNPAVTEPTAPTDTRDSNQLLWRAVKHVVQTRQTCFAQILSLASLTCC